MAWIDVLDENALAEGEMAPVYPLGVNIVVARVEGTLYALSGKCAHMACPLFMGALERHTLVCPCHDWRFDIRTGRLRADPDLSVPTYPVRTEGGRILVEV